MALVFRSTAATVLRATLDEIVDDDMDGMSSLLQHKKWCDTSVNMTGAFMDDQEFGGPAYGSERFEGQEIAQGVLTEGYQYRYITRSFALGMAVTEEMEEDNKYPEVLRLAQRCKRAMYKTKELDATSMLTFAESATRTYGDGVAMASASHTLPAGGTWSNTTAVPMSPGIPLVVAARTQAMKFPDHDGTIGTGYDLKKVVFPVEQWAVWEQLLKSKINPDAGNFSEINVVNQSMDLEPIGLKMWTNTTTNCAFITDADNGVQLRTRKDFKGRSWVDNSRLVMRFACTGRWARGMSDARGILFNGA